MTGEEQRPDPPVAHEPLPWQGEAWLHLDRQIASGRLPHALLFAGPQHTGKGHLAQCLARRLLCHEPSGGLPCERCHACDLSASGGHGDMRWVQPEEKSRVIKIDQVRELVDFSHKTASFGRCKVLVLAPADSMNASAANALLKSLEEPAADTYLILVCHRLHGLPATIRSRCQILRLPAPAPAESRRWMDRLTGSPEESSQLLSLARGLPLLAEQIYRTGQGAERTALHAALRSGCLGEEETPEIAARLSGMTLDEVLAHLAAVLEDLLRGLDQDQLAGPTGRGVFALLDEIARLQRAVFAGANPNPQLMTEGLLVKSRRVLGDARLGDNMVKKGGRIYE